MTALFPEAPCHAAGTNDAQRLVPVDFFHFLLQELFKFSTFALQRQTKPGAFSFDYLVDAREQRRRHGNAKGPGSLHIDDQLVKRRLLDRQIGRPGTFKNFRVNHIRSGVDQRRASRQKTASNVWDGATASHGRAIHCGRISAMPPTATELMRRKELIRSVSSPTFFCPSGRRGFPSTAVLLEYALVYRILIRRASEPAVCLLGGRFTPWRPAMLQDLSTGIRECLQSAEECRRLAKMRVHND